MTTGTIFPAFLKIEHQPNTGAKASFLAEVRGMTEQAQRQFESSFNEIGRVVDKSLASIRGKGVQLDLGVSGLRQTAAEAEMARLKLVAMQDAAGKLAARTGDTSAETRKYLQALSAQVVEATRAKDAADAQVLTYERLQGAIDRTVRSNQRLAESYRATYLEQARQENFAYRSQQAVNAGFAPGLTRPIKSAAASASVFENYRYAPRADTRVGVDSLLGGNASLDRAAVAATSLDQVLGRVAQKGPMVSAALAQVAEAEQRAARQTAALAQSIDQLEAELDPMVAVQQRFNAQMRQADHAFAAGAIGAERYQRIQGQLQQNLQRTRQVMAGTSGAIRQATLQSGQQLQDLGISLYSGQQAAIVFAQQLPQLAFALTGLEGSANKTQDRIGRFATFLSGPWGLAVGVAIGVTADLVADLLGFGEEVDKANKKSYDFTQTLDYWTLGAKRTADAMQQLADATRAAIAEQGDFLVSQKANADAALSTIEQRLAANRAELERLKGEAGSFSLDPSEASRRVYRVNALRDAIAADELALPSARSAVNAAEIATAQRRVIDSMDAASAATTRYKTAVGELNKRLEETRKDPIGAQLSGRALSGKDYEAEFARIKAQYDREIVAERARKREERTGVRATADFISPLDGSYRRTGSFGEPRPGHRHAGIDFAAPVGTAVRAPQVGVVEAVGFSPTLGKFVVIDHGGGTKTRFGHLSDNSLVAKGDAVQQGDTIGRVGSTGRSTGPHLHYEVRVNGKAVDPSSGKFPIDDVKVAEAAEKARQVLEQFGARSGESIQRINERFDEQPRLIDQAARATRELDSLIAELGERRPAGFEQMIADAERAKDVVADALVRPFRELARDSQRTLQIQELMIGGREREADVLQEVWRLQERLGDLLPDQVAEVRRIVEAEYDRAEALKIIQQQMGDYLDATRSIRQEVEGLFSGRKADFGNVFKQLNARVLTEQLFGDIFRDMDKWVQRNTGLGRATDAFTQSTEQAGSALDTFTSSLLDNAGRISGGGVAGIAANDNLAAGAAAVSSLVAATARLVTGGGTVAGPVGPNGVPETIGTEEIVAQGVRRGLTSSRSVFAMSPEAYFDRMSVQMAAKITGSLDSAFGTQFFSKFQGVVAGSVYGGAVGGTPGAVLGGVRGLAGLFGGGKGLDKLLGKGIEGAGTGSLVSSLSNALGIKMNSTGAQIGGAAGSFLPIPGGDIIGSVIGGLLGNLFGKSKSRAAILSGGDGGPSISGYIGGTKGDYQRQADSLGGSLIDSLERIAEQLGGSATGKFNVSIGTRDGKFVVNPTGGGTKKSMGAVNFGEDEEAALKFALRDIIRDGGIMGLSALENAILTKSEDLEKAVEQVLQVQDVFKRYRQWKDPLGAAMDELDKEFSKLRDIFVANGATAEEMVKLEELYGKERADVIKQQREQVTGALKSLYDDLGIGDNGLSLRSRLKNAQAVYNPLAERVRAGDTTAFDDFAEAGRTVLDLQRQINGSQTAYFAFFDELRGLTKSTLDAQQAAIDAAAGRNSPFSASTVPVNDNASVVSAIDAQTQAIIDALTAQGVANAQNMTALINALRANQSPNVLAAVGNGGFF